MSVWFAKENKDGTTALTRFEALDLLMKVNNLLAQERYFQAMAAIGMEGQPFEEQIPLEELAQIFAVRLSDLCKYAGIDLNGGK